LKITVNHASLVASFLTIMTRIDVARLLLCLWLTLLANTRVEVTPALLGLMGAAPSTGLTIPTTCISRHMDARDWLIVIAAFLPQAMWVTKGLVSLLDVTPNARMSGIVLGGTQALVMWDLDLTVVLCCLPLVVTLPPLVTLPRLRKVLEEEVVCLDFTLAEAFSFGSYLHVWHTSFS
jgi:hypothetical protein